jgi:circadian clock protein KaiC
VADRLQSGHAPLDDVLGGGLPANAISLIMGRPGTGKTILAQQYAFRNAQPGRPVVYFSTVSEPLEKIARFGQSLAFFDTAAIGTSVFYEDLGAVLSQGGLTEVAEQLGRTVRERRPGLIVVDSFKALQAFAADYGEFRRFLHELAGRLGAFPAASLWVGEYEDAEIAAMAEFAVADAILSLTSERVGQREARFLQVKSSAAARSAPASMPTGSPPTGCGSSPGSRTPRSARTTQWATSGSRRASPPWTTCWPTATGPAPQPWSPAPPARGKRSWACTS